MQDCFSVVESTPGNEVAVARPFGSCLGNGSSFCVEGLFISLVVGGIVEENTVASLFILRVVDDVVDKVDVEVEEGDVGSVAENSVNPVVTLVFELLCSGEESVDFKVKLNIRIQIRSNYYIYLIDLISKYS